jgi:hypothetical protein
MSSSQTNLIKAIVHKEEKLISTTVMQKYRLGTPRNVSKNKATLIKNDLVQLIDKRLELLDPAFELWFNCNFIESQFSSGYSA